MVPDRACVSELPEARLIAKELSIARRICAAALNSGRGADAKSARFDVLDLEAWAMHSESQYIQGQIRKVLGDVAASAKFKVARRTADDALSRLAAATALAER